MNFLAHCLIPDRAVERPHPDLIAGGFLGDFVKGPVPDDLPARLADGIRLHRRIDAYSNRHPAIRRSCDRFPAPLRRFAPIFVDVVADHLLASDWRRFHPARLTDFTAEAYAAIGPREALLSESGRRFFHYMRDADLLARYRRPEAMHRALASITRRLNRSDLDDALADAVDAALPALREDFFDYLPDLIEHAADWLTAGSER